MVFTSTCGGPAYLCVAAEAEAVAESGAERDHILECTAQLGTRDVVNRADAERRAVEQALPDGSVGGIRVADRRLTELIAGDLHPAAQEWSRSMV